VRSPEGLARRLATAGALLAGFLAALFLLPPRGFALLVAAVVALAGLEWGRLSGLGTRAAAAYGGILGVLVAAAAWLPVAEGAWRDLLLGAGAVFWLLLAPAWLYRGMGRAGGPACAAAGVVVLLVAALAALSLPSVELLLVLGLAWVADTAAYFAGNAYGRRKLAPRLSPGKTWEGVAGAAVATGIYAIICAWPGGPLNAAVHGLQWAAYLAGAALLCAVGILGDLFESALKRRAGAKDSGALLPGHGGILDRIDSAMPTLPIAAILLQGLPRA
jgi:phosphatidate cytidylyltransferase